MAVFHSNQHTYNVKEYIRMKNKHYKERRNNEMTSTLISLLVEGADVSHATHITNQIYPMENCFFDCGNAIGVLD